jgi:hypothetical protein
MAKYANGQQTSKRHFVQAVKSIAGCIDCGRTEPVALLDFDHRDPGIKSFEINEKTRGEIFVSFGELVAEMDKCDVRCRWCHTRRHVTEDPDLVRHAGLACWGIPRPNRRRLTPDQVIELQRRYAQGEVSQRALAAEYGISHQTVGNYLKGRHVGGEAGRRRWLYGREEQAS